MLAHYESHSLITASTNPLSAPPTECLECAKNFISCGNGCVPMQGSQPVLCSHLPGCAVNNGNGSSLAYPTLTALNLLSKQQAVVNKALLAEMKVTSIDGHLATPTLATNAERILAIVQDILACANVTCPEPDQCHLPVQCLAGHCPTLPTQPDGYPCNDGIQATDNDACWAGVCRGVDLCANVTCHIASQCSVLDGCSHGHCFYSQLPVGSPCDDNNTLTDNDLCIAPLTCAGTDYCANVTCPEAACLHAGVCQRPSGTCSLGAPKSSDTPCNDSNDRTINDKCSNGTCIGVDPCVSLGIVCSPIDQCHNSGDCFLGVCSNPVKLDGDSCDDHNNRTTSDQCVAGHCHGKDLCITNGVLCLATDQCHDFGDCFQGLCSNPALPNGTTCDDGNPFTDNDQCVTGVCMGYNRCDGVVCQALDQCHRLGQCSHGVCSNPTLPDGTVCNDNDPFTDFDTCYNGNCAGIAQPTIGPLKEHLALQTVTTLSLNVASGLTNSTLQLLINVLINYLTKTVPSVYPQDVNIATTMPSSTANSSSGTSTRVRRLAPQTIILNISLDTRAFSEAYILAQLTKALQDPALVRALQAAYPALQSVNLLRNPEIGMTVVFPWQSLGF